MAGFRRSSRSRIGVLVFLLLILVLVPAGADAQIDPTLERWYLMGRPTGESSFEYRGDYTVTPGNRANIAISPIDGQYRYDALSTNGMLVSHDGGVNWTNVASRTAANVDVMQVVASSVDARTVFANFNRTLFFSGDGGFNWGYVTQPVEFFNVSRDARKVYSVSDAGISTIESGQTRYQFAPAWEPNYDTPVNGVVAVDAADPNTAYAVVNRLLLVTSDGGASWGTPSLFANVLFDHVLANDTVSGLAYALSDNAGLYRTTNGGVSWGLVADLSPYADWERSYPKLLYARDDRLLFSGTAAAQRLPCDDVIYVSEDRGATWNTEGTAVSLEGAQACAGVVYNVTSSPAGQLVGLVTHIPTVHLYSYTRGKTLITSSDGGDHWQVVKPASDGTRWFSVSADGRVIYLNAGEWLARSTDGGETWTHLAVNLKTITLDANDPDTIYGVSSGVFRSRDGGETWTRLPVPSIYSPASYPFAAVYAPPSRSGVVYLMQPNLYSTDYGETWTPLGGDTDRDYYVAAANPADPNQIFFGATSFGLGGSGLYWSGDGGERVGLRGLGPEWSIVSIAFDPSQPSTLYTSASTNGQVSLYESSDEGVTWLPVADVTSVGTGGPGLYSDERFPGTLVVDPRDSNTLYMSRQGVYLSRDGGHTWEEFMRGMSPQETVTSLAITDTTLWAVGASGLWRMSLN